jgi:hypothetical protein
MENINMKPNPRFIYKVGDLVKVWEDDEEDWHEDYFLYVGFIEDCGEILYIVKHRYSGSTYGQYYVYNRIEKVGELDEVIEYGEDVEVRDRSASWVKLDRHQYLGSVVDLNGNKVHVTSQAGRPNLWRSVRKVRKDDSD